FTGRSRARSSPPSGRSPGPPVPRRSPLLRSAPEARPRREESRPRSMGQHASEAVALAPALGSIATTRRKRRDLRGAQSLVVDFQIVDRAFEARVGELGVMAQPERVRGE